MFHSFSDLKKVRQVLFSKQIGKVITPYLQIVNKFLAIRLIRPYKFNSALLLPTIMGTFIGN